ncbi:hypothetical protein FXO37_25698 [Capsicum annuum]|nr:hypothetical protein FXO37_25698 [Capsicum annuum]
MGLEILRGMFIVEVVEHMVQNVKPPNQERLNIEGLSLRETIMLWWGTEVKKHLKPYYKALPSIINLANPTALLLSSVSMLHHLELHDKADSIQDSILRTIAEGKYRTGDLGGTASTTEFTIANHL